MKIRGWRRAVMELGALGLLAGLAVGGDSGWRPGRVAVQPGHDHGYGSGGYRYGGSRGRNDGFAFDRGWQNGQTKGFEKGRKDFARGRRFDLWRHDAYREADGGYRSGYGHKAAYRDGYRQGFERGYRQGYGRHPWQRHW